MKELTLQQIAVHVFKKVEYCIVHCKFSITWSMIDDLHGAIILYPKFPDDYVVYAAVNVIPCVRLIPSMTMDNNVDS